MPVIDLSDEQVLALVMQLPVQQQRTLLASLITKQWPEWTRAQQYGEQRARATAAARGRNWDKMTDDERLDFVDALVHEGHSCRG